MEYGLLLYLGDGEERNLLREAARARFPELRIAQAPEDGNLEELLDRYRPRVLAAGAECPELRRLEPEGDVRLLLLGDRSFEAAYGALRAGAEDLLVRPVEPQAFLEALDRALASRLTPQQKTIGKLFFTRLREGAPEKQPSEEMVNLLYGTRFRSGGYRVVVVKPDLADPAGDRSLWRGERHIDELLSRLAPRCRELLADYDFLLTRIFLNYDSARDAELLKILRDWLEERRRTLPPDRVRLTLGCSQVHGEMREACRMQAEAADAVWARFTRGTGRMLLYRPEPPCAPELQALYDSYEQRLKSACALLDLREFNRTLEEFFSLPSSVGGRSEARVLIRRVESYLFEINRDLISVYGDADQANLAMMRVLRGANSLEEYGENYRRQLSGVLERAAEVARGHGSRPIRLARHYIAQNCRRPVRLEEVAAQVGLSPVYLSSLFKRETGMRLTDYVNRCRLEAAKELLRGGELKIAAVAAEVGFASPRYFSRLFRESEGLRPTEYRRLVRR